jgi:hypothetical protein
MRQVLALLREPPLPGGTAIPYLGDLYIYEQVLGIVAKDKIALNAAGRWWHKEPAESPKEALIRLKQRASFSGQAMWALPDAQRVTQAVLTLSGVSVKELRDLCVKLPPKLQAELQLNLPPEGGSTQ